MESWVQTSILICRKIIIRGWEPEEVSSLQEWATELARVSAFENISCKQLCRKDIYEGKWGKYGS